MAQNIIVRRQGALGDVILTTPVVRRLRQENPSTHISVMTGFPNVYRYSPHVSPDPVNGNDFKVIDLDLAYERNPHVHIVQSYMQQAFGDDGEPETMQQQLFFRKTPSKLRHRPLIAVHAARAGWANRTLPRLTWGLVVQYLTKAGFWPILVGTERDDVPEAGGVTRFQTPDNHAQAALIANCAAFVGSDSALLHVAGATDTPIVGVFTCALPETRLPWRHGVMGWRCEAGGTGSAVCRLLGAPRAAGHYRILRARGHRLCGSR